MSNLNKTSQRLVEESFDSVLNLSFKQGEWVITSPTDDGWVDKVFKGQVKFDLSSLHDGYVAFTRNDDDSPGQVLLNYASGDQPAIDRNNLPLVRYREFDGTIKEGVEGWRRSVKMTGAVKLKKGGVSGTQAVRFTAHNLSGVRAVQNIFREAQNHDDRADPVVNLTSGAFVARDGVERKIPKFEIVRWEPLSAPEPTATAEPAKVEDAGSLDELEDTVNGGDWT